MGEIRPTIYRATIQPRQVVDGATVTFRVAGGGYRCPYRFAGVDYRSGLSSVPRFKAQIDFDEKGWSGGVQPSTDIIEWSPSRAVDYAALANDYLWTDAPITIEAGEELPGGVEPSSWSTVLVGTVAGASAQNGTIAFTVADLSEKLDKPFVTATFAGTGGIEGPVEKRGQVKRRSWGHCYNVECRILDKANNVWEFGDPAFPVTSVDAVRDMGRDAVPAPTVVAWQGTIAATFSALQAATVAAGSAVVAPSIQCVKWWTQPVGPLTVDVVGEVGSGPAAGIAQAMLTAVGGGITLSGAERDALNAVRPGNCGVHIGDDRTTIAQTLDALFLGVSTAWIADSAGVVRLRPFTFTGPVASLNSQQVARKKVFRPHKSRRLGYKRNNRIHNEGEISAALQVPFSDNNRVRYSRFESGTKGWVSWTDGATVSNFFTGFAGGNGVEFLRADGSFTTTVKNVHILSDGPTTGDTRFRIPVTALERIFIGAKIEVQAANAGWGWQLFVDYRDSANTNIGYGIVASGNGSVAFNTQVGGFATVPAGATWASIELKITNTGGTAGAFVLALREPMIVSATSGQSDFPTFAAGPATDPTADNTASNTAVGDANRVRFSRFEAGLRGWGAMDNPSALTFAASTGTSGGKPYLAGVASFTANSQYVAIGTNTGELQYRVPITGGERIFAGAGVGVGVNLGGLGTWRVDLGWLDAGGSEVGSRLIVGQGTGPVGFNTKVGAFANAPSTAVWAFFRFYLFNNTAGALANVDWYLVEPMVVSAGASQTTWPAFTAGPTGESAADVTANITGPAQSDIVYDYTGATFQSADDLVYKVQTAFGTATSGVTLTYTVESGTFNGFNSTNGPQSLTLTSGVASITPTSLATSSATLVINGTYNGRPLPQFRTILTKALALAPSGGAGGGGGGGTDVPAQSSGFTVINTATYTAITGVLKFTLPAGKTTLRIDIGLNPKMLPKTANSQGPWNVQYKVQRGGVDQGTAQDSNPDPYINVDGELPVSSPGTMLYTLDMTGLTAGVQYSVQVLARISSGTLPTTPGGVGMNFTGNVQLSAP